MTPEYYKTNITKSSLGECIRIKGGIVQGVCAWLLLRFVPGIPERNFWLLPSLFHDIQVKKEELSTHCLSRIDPQIGAFQTLGFHPVASVTNMRHNIHPDVRDNGACWLLHESGDYTACTTYIQMAHIPPRTGMTETMATTVSCHLRSGRVLVATNSKQYLDPLPETRVFYQEGASPAQLFGLLEGPVKKVRSSDPPIKVVTLEKMAELSDARNIGKFEMQLERGFYIRMTQEEIAAARAECQRWRPDEV